MNSLTKEEKIAIYTRMSNLSTAKLIETFKAECVNMNREETIIWTAEISFRKSPEMARQ